jgi:predicted transcriptional regulator of viral defense system
LLRRFHETNVLIDFDERYAARMAGTRQDRRLGLQRLAFSQAGYVTAAQARNLGYSYQAQKYHVDSGNWLRVDRGLFRLPDWPPAPEDQWVRWTLWSNGRGVVSHDSAALVHDLGELDPRRVHLSVPVEFRAVDPAVVTHPTELLTKDVLDHGAWRVTTPLRTLLDLARGDTTQEQVTAAVAAALEQGLTTVRRIRTRSDEAGDRAALRIERALGSAAKP